MREPNTPPTHDIAVVGGGPAGYFAAIKGAQAGFRVACIEKNRIGGACINRGCIPTKALWGTAVELDRLRNLKSHGIKAGKISFDFGVAVERQFAIIDRMVGTIRARMDRLGVHSMAAEVTGIEKAGSGFSIATAGGAAIHARFVLVATGSRPAENEVLKPDHRKILTTDDIVVLKKLPKRLCIVGGGVVACEFASILNRFGVEIHLLEHSTQVLSSMDPEVVNLLEQKLESDGVQIHKNTKVTLIDRSRATLFVSVVTDGEDGMLDTDAVLLAIGRKPNVEGLGLERLGVKLGPRGNIVVDARMQTDCPGLYAAGDVIGGPMLAHKAWYDAGLAVRAMAGEEVTANYNTVPGAIFTIPEMASVGMQADQARQKGHSVCIGKFPYGENSQAMCVGNSAGMVKVVADRDTGQVLGATMLGHDASNLIAEAALAIANGMSITDVTKTIHPHPTLSEMVWESFLDTQGLSIHKG